VSTALPRPNGGPTVRTHLESPAFKEAVAKALPRHLTPDRFIRVACTTLMKTPKLANCDQASFFNALLSLSQLGLEPDGRRAHLIPFGNQCQLIIDYKGLVELIFRSGTVSKLHADVVCEQDEFDYDRGEIKRHTINFRKPRGPVYAAYALATLKDGTEKAEVLGMEEVEAVRKRSKAANAGPWVTDWNEMAKKTAFRRLSKWLPLSPELRDAVEADDELPPKPVAAPAESLVAVMNTFEVPAADEPAEAQAGLAPEPPAEREKPAALSETQQLKEIVETAGYDFATFIRVMSEGGMLKDADSLPDWDAVPKADAERLIRLLRGAKTRPVMLQQFEMVKGGAK